MSAVMFRFAMLNEDRFAGDFEWSLFYGALFVSSLVSGSLLSSQRNLIAVVWLACLVPFVAPGMFMLVSMVFCLVVSLVGATVGGCFKKAKIRWS